MLTDKSVMMEGPGMHIIPSSNVRAAGHFFVAMDTVCMSYRNTHVIRNCVGVSHRIHIIGYWAS